MDHAHHAHLHPAPARASLGHTALLATIHCLAGCALGEVAGLFIGTALGWGNGPTVALAVALAFVSGFGLTMLPLLRQGDPLRVALRIALAADAASITVMEIVDNAFMLLVPGAMNASIDSRLFWASMAASLLVAGVLAYPVNRWLIARGRGHAVVHARHGAS